MEAKTYFFILVSFLAVSIQTSLQQQCLTTMDLIFLMDGSNSMGVRNFQRQKDSLNGLVSSLNISEAEVHVGLVLFSRIVNDVIELTGNKSRFMEANSKLEYPDEETRLDLAIDKAIDMFNKTGRNSTVPKVIMVITDGVSTEPNKTQASANLAKSLGIRIFAIGVTNATDKAELTSISSPGTQVFITEDFLTLESVLNNATNRVCMDLQTTTESPSTTSLPATTTTQPATTTTQPPTTTSQPATTTTQPPTTTSQPATTTTQPPTTTSQPTANPTQQPANATKTQNVTATPPTTAGLCAGSGHRENGVGVVAHPKDCDKYIQCYYDALKDLDLGVVRNCPMGLHWNSLNGTCTAPHEAKCSTDRCKEGCSEYKMEGACGAYWGCEDGVSSPKCCQQNYTFVPDLGCQLDDTCRDLCGKETWCGKCQKKPNWTLSSGYDVMILGGNMWLPRPCFYEDFDIVDCDCTVPREHACPADRVFDFKDATTRDAINKGSQVGIRVSDVTYNPEAVVLGQKSAVHVSVDRVSREKQPFTLEFRFRELQPFSPYGESLISSGTGCGTSSSLLLSANDEFIFAEIRTGDHVSEVKVPLKGLNKEDFKDLVLSYQEGVLALSIKDEQKQYIAKTQAPDSLCFSCGLDIGQGLNKLSFNGEIEKIAVYSCVWRPLY